MYIWNVNLEEKNAWKEISSALGMDNVSAQTIMLHETGKKYLTICRNQYRCKISCLCSIIQYFAVKSETSLFHQNILKPFFDETSKKRLELSV